MVCSPGRVCECMRGHYPSEDRRGCIATTSGLCFETSDCNTLPSSSCFILDQFEGTCTCNDAYTSSEDERECLPDASFHGSCREAVQCVSRLGFYAVCREGQCECQNNYHYSITEERCIGDVGLLGPCVNTSQCVTRGEQNAVVCLDGRCSCSQGYEQFQDYCRAGAHKAVLAGTTFFLYWIIKAVIT
ncbi:tenascin-like isoform X2 [Zootermopsis nevadensis]|uniref:tenascin-like isoform X2 n=1 Tax=Zootermopsis nevadensis TaxID=136037 RepID=UPI000B8E325E|nr:tenascin-like isoform X2 [Zootermopsis nevadensis]